jgi:hypothetical protein
MKKTIILCFIGATLLSTSILFSSCSKKSTTTTTTTPTSTLAENSWTVDGVLYKMSAFGYGWASTNFAPRFGLTDYTTVQGSTETIEMNFVEQPTINGAYTIETYTKVHLQQITSGKIVGMQVMHNNEIYYSTSTSGTANLSINGRNIIATLTDVILTDLNTNKTIKVSAHFKCTWK